MLIYFPILQMSLSRRQVIVLLKGAVETIEEETLARTIVLHGDGNCAKLIPSIKAVLSFALARPLAFDIGTSIFSTIHSFYLSYFIFFDCND